MAYKNLAAFFPELTGQSDTDPMPPAILRGLYDQLLETSSQPEAVRTILRELLQARQTLHIYIDKCAAMENVKTNTVNELYEEREKNAALEESSTMLKKKIVTLQERIDETIRDVLDAETSLALEKDKVKEVLVKEEAVVEGACKKQAKTILDLKAKRKAPTDDDSKDTRSVTRPHIVGLLYSPCCANIPLTSHSVRSSKKPKPSPLHHANVACTQCYTKAGPYDGAQHCSNCIKRGLSKEKCKRLKCPFFHGTCKKQACGLAHRMNGYNVVKDFVKTRQKRKRDLPA
jgi:hypothetical protein